VTVAPGRGKSNDVESEVIGAGAVRTSTGSFLFVPAASCFVVLFVISFILLWQSDSLVIANLVAFQ
jgi:hypothetical protein